MAETRIRGQEVSIRISRNANVESTITAVKDFTVQLDMATLDEGYLGETTMRKDDIFNGVSGSFTIDHESQDILVFMDFIKQRAQRRIPVNQSRANATGRFTFPNGDVPRLLIPDMKFDAIPISVPGRNAYVNSSFSYKAEDVRFITT
jgi:hypothetical protein